MNTLDKLKEILDIMQVEYEEETDGENETYILTNDLSISDDDICFVFNSTTKKFIRIDFL